MRSLYPPEAVVFEIVGTDGRVIPNGTHVEGIEINPAGLRGYKEVRYRDHRAIGVRNPDHSQLAPSRHPTEGWGGAVIHCNHLRPLTRAAREMLALVSGGAA